MKAKESKDLLSQRLDDAEKRYVLIVSFMLFWDRGWHEETGSDPTEGSLYQVPRIYHLS